MSVLDWWRRVLIGWEGLGWPGWMWAQEPGRGTAEGQTGSAHLPLKRIVLFTAGVGFFEHQGELIDQAQVELRFRTENINDLLKSMVVIDEGGNVPVVTYASKDPISRTLKSFAVDLTANPTLGELLNQLRGERVRVSAPGVGRDPGEDSAQEIDGLILGVEVRNVKQDNEFKKTEFLTLVTDKGIRSLDLAKDVRTITLVS